ncbi:hypothetical protein [Cupriavidus necator]
MSFGLERSKWKEGIHKRHYKKLCKAVRNSLFFEIKKIFLISKILFWRMIVVTSHQFFRLTVSMWKMSSVLTAEGSMFFTFRELAAVALTGADNYILDLLKDESGKWVIRATILEGRKQPLQSYIVQTNRGKPKTWRYLEDALVFIDGTCANCRHLTIKVEGRLWSLRAGAADDVQ